MFLLRFCFLSVSYASASVQSLTTCRRVVWCFGPRVIAFDGLFKQNIFQRGMSILVQIVVYFKLLDSIRMTLILKHHKKMPDQHINRLCGKQ